MSFDEMMAGLKRDYIKSMPDKIQRIQQVYNTADLKQLREEFHKLKGTGKTYGVPEITDLCAAIEQLCLEQSPHAINDVKTALQILGEIHCARASEQAFNVVGDKRFTEIQKHLQGAR